MSAGCGLFETKKVYVERVVYKTYDIPEEALTVDAIPSPPDVDSYAVSSSADKEDALRKYIDDLQTYIGVMVNKLKSVGKMIDDQKKTIDAASTPKK